MVTWCCLLCVSLSFMDFLKIVFSIKYERMELLRTNSVMQDLIPKTYLNDYGPVALTPQSIIRFVTCNYIRYNHSEM